jgi:hypothetical protein
MAKLVGIRGVLGCELFHVNGHALLPAGRQLLDQPGQLLIGGDRCL